MGAEYWKAWFKAAAIRAIRTAAQTAVGVIGGSAVMGDVSWQIVGSAALLAAILSILMSIAGLPEVEKPALDVPKGDALEPTTLASAIEPPASKDE